MPPELESPHITWDVCAECTGHGYKTGEHEPCPSCSGQGRVKPAGWVNPDPLPRTCPRCKGTGVLSDKDTGSPSPRG